MGRIKFQSCCNLEKKFMKNTLINKRTMQPWTLREVTYLLRDRNLERDELNQNSMDFDCIQDHPFGGCRARLNKVYGVLEWEVRCSLCRQERIDEVQALEDWLNSFDLDTSGLRPHYNPMLATETNSAPSFLPDTTGRNILYKGLIHFLYGKPGTLKSWLALSLVRQHQVRFWDFENGVAVTGARLKALNTPEESAAVFDSPTSADDVKARIKEYTSSPVDILCIDGFSGLAGVLGIDPDSNQDVLGVFTNVFAPLRRAGIAIIVLDHLPKDSTIEDFPIGAQAKKSQSDVALLAKLNPKSSQVELYVSKDRVGLVSARCKEGKYPRLLATLSLEETDEEVIFSVSPVEEAYLGVEKVDTFRAQMMEAIWEFVHENPDSSQTEIEKGVKGKNETVREVTDFLVSDQYLTRKIIGKMRIHNIGKPLEMKYQAIH